MSDFPEEGFKFFATLPRQAPGSEARTRAVLRRLPPLPENPAVADVGCGTGAAAFVLAEELRAPVRAFDISPILLDVLTERAAARGQSALVLPEVADMAALPVAPGSLDLLWAEGSVFILGLEQAFHLWRPLMTPGGILVLSDAVWLTDAPPPEAEALWQEYPTMGTPADAIARAEAAGWKVLFTEVLEPEAWDAYLDSIRA
ncbi:MAG: class I SAM-dependent methyltransferase, partial [Rhodospirillaceae bacterium]